jgi:hypothetical protein
VAAGEDRRGQPAALALGPLVEPGGEAMRLEQEPAVETQIWHPALGDEAVELARAEPQLPGSLGQRQERG